MDKKQLEFLKDMGLTSTESKVYLTLIEIGKSLAGSVASNSNLYRKNVYDALENLSSKGFVTSHKEKNKKYWEAISPNRIKTMLKEKMDYADKIIPKILSKFNNKKSDQSVEIFQGKGGVKSFNKIMLNEGKNVYNIGANAKIFKRMEFYAENYFDLIKENNITIYSLLLNDSDKQGVEKLKKIKNIKMKILPKSFKTPTQMYMFADYTGIWIWSENPLAILIKSKKITKGFLEYFKFMERLSKPL